MPISKTDQIGKHRKIKIITPDKWFSKFIRIRDAIENGYGPCITCGKWIYWKAGHCGHFATRNHVMTRFNEQNAHLQCIECNTFKSGEQAKHAIAIDKLYGIGTAEVLIGLSEARGQKAYTKLALKSISDEYRKKTKVLAKEKGIKL